MNTIIIENNESHDAGLSREPGNGFVVTPYVEEVVESALAYLQSGYPAHFSGPAGTGKTTLAIHVAARLGRPVTLIYGDDEFTTSDLFDRETETKILEANSGILRQDAEIIIDIIRKLRNTGVNNHRPSIRAGIMTDLILANRGGHAAWNDPIFRRICQDVLNANTIKVTRDGKLIMQEKIAEVVQNVCGRNQMELDGAGSEKQEKRFPAFPFSPHLNCKDKLLASID
ncbi:MAG: gas vesicle protein GvpN [Candidatus Brocadiaceae bacterium]|nr:gas vesicle protein GvpN [Candidatus Brocadiaceae bacterium]